MGFECIGLNGFAGDRSPDAMRECHIFAAMFASHFNFPLRLIGEPAEVRDLTWEQALIESKSTFEAAAANLKDVLSSGHAPILVTPRCATAIATLPIIIAQHPDVVILYFDAHGDLNLPSTSESGYLGGMPITAALGEWDSGYGAGLKVDNLIHIGGRDLDDSELDFIEQNSISVLSKAQIERNLSDLKQAIKGRPIFIHLDTDVYDPSEVTAEYAVEDGLFTRHVRSVVDLVLAEAQLVGLEITELSPSTEQQRAQSYKALLASFQGLDSSMTVR